MAIYSTGLRNKMLDTGSVKSLMDNARLRIYAAATIPATADEALSGSEVLMYEFTVGNDGTTDLTFEASAAGGVLQKTSTESWQGEALAADDMAFYRLYVPPDDPATLSTTAARIQGTVGTAFADLIVDNVTKALNDPLTVDAYAIALPVSYP